MTFQKETLQITKTPPSTPTETEMSVQPSSANITEAVHLFKELLAAVKSSSDFSKSTDVGADQAKAEEPKDNDDPPPQRRYKTVVESWDASEHKYRVLEQTATASSDPEPLAFIVRNRIDKISGTSTHHIDIKSTKLCNALKNVLGTTTRLSVRDDQSTIERAMLFHYTGELQSFVVSKTREASEASVDILVEHLLDAFDQTRKTLDELLSEAHITYDLIWALLKPGDILYTTCPGTKLPKCIRFSFCEERQTTRGQAYLHVEGHCLAFDGKIFGESRVSVMIEKFRGAKKLHLLQAFPLKYHPDSETIREQLTASGRKFINLIGTHYRQCRGPAFFMHQGDPLPVQVNGRVAIDAELFRLMNPSYIGPEIDKPSREHMNVWIDWDFLDESERGNTVRSADLSPSEVGEKELLLCSPTIFGFSFADKLWLEIGVSGISDIEWDESAWDRLVLPEKPKEILLALASVHAGHRKPQATGTVARGRGLNMLFHGPPGVGKTLSAECLAEHLKRPLYQVSAGELGTDPRKLDACLCDLFRLAKSWDAILLFDEADVYLEQRNTENVTRNALVSVFLRQLERFDGVLIFTTNRVHDFDDAVLDRLQWKMRFHDMNEMTRADIWQKDLKKVEAQIRVTITKEEMQDLVKKSINGREIANHISTASALARAGGKPLSYSFLRAVIDEEEEFERNLTHAERSESLYT